MVKIETVRASNAQCKRFTGLVCVFIGATGGIGETTIKEVFRHTTRPRAYIVGRNEENGNRICCELKELNPEGEACYIKKDVSLLKNVDELCEELVSRERKINLLCLTSGYMSLEGRNDTEEGLDAKMAVNYYSRARAIFNLLPLLNAASQMGELARVKSVLAAGSEAEINLDDLDLKHSYTLQAALTHCVVMTDFILMEYQARNPRIAFFHCYPGRVKSSIVKELSGPVRLAAKLFYSVMTPWILTVKETGERLLFQMTSAAYPSAEDDHGVPLVDELEVEVGADGRKGSGVYLLDWDGHASGDEKQLGKFMEMDLGRKIWEHTMFIFKRARHESYDPIRDVYR